MRSWASALTFLLAGLGLQLYVDRDWGAVILLLSFTATAILAITSPQVRQVTAITVVRNVELTRLLRIAEQQTRTKDWEGGLRKLGNLRGVGVELRNRGDAIYKRNDVTEWIAEADRWGQETAKEIDALSPTSAAFFRVINKFRSYAVRGGLSKEHNMALAVLDERLSRLEAFMQGSGQHEA